MENGHKIWNTDCRKTVSEDVERLHLAQEKDQWQAPVNTLTDLWVQ